LGGVLLTIAVCYLSTEGVVLGADSTTTYGDTNGNHYYNHGQKLFEIGEESQFGLVTWGMGGLPNLSYRTLVATLGDALKVRPAKTVSEVMDRWIDLFWPAYESSPLVQECRSLSAKTPHNALLSVAGANDRTKAEEDRLNELLSNLVVGFCIAGCDPKDRTPAGFQVLFDGVSTTKPIPVASPMYNLNFWGAPNFILRLFLGIDSGLKHAILTSGKWSGTPQEFDAIAAPHALSLFALPMREAVDLVHSCITATIKALKFSSLSQICGGPIEIAVITSDRKFRWVRHKPWDSAIQEGDLS
jgi:hypothetical protein